MSFIFVLIQFLMIFNSIAQELTNSRHRKAQYKTTDYHPAHQPNNTNYSRYSHNYSMNSSQELPERGSALAHMNQKITENINYLHYKDAVKQKELQMSRVSSRSNHSRQSRRSNHSMRSSSHANVSNINSNSRYSIRTSPHQHYFPQKKVIKPEFHNWEKPKAHLYQPRMTTTNTNYREFLRTPITIEEYGTKYGLGGGSTVENRRPEKDNYEFQTKTNTYPSPSNMNFDSFKSTQTFRSPQQMASDKLAATSPVNKDWLNSFGDRFPKEPALGTHRSSSRSNHSQKSNAARICEQYVEKVFPPKNVSPLEQSPKKSMSVGLIVGIWLVVLGLVLFGLQMVR